MMKGIWFNGVHSFKDLNLILSQVDLPPAAVKTTFVDNPGGDGSWDLTEATGKVNYKNRECKFTFSVLPTDDFEAKKTEVSNLLSGKRVKIILDKDPDYFWDGRCSINKYETKKKIRKIVVSANVAPYKYKHDPTIVDVELTVEDCSSTATGNPVYIDDMSAADHSVGMTIRGMSRKCTNLWSFGDLSITEYVDLPLDTPLPAGTYTISANAESTDTDTTLCLVSFLKGGTNNATVYAGFYHGTFTTQTVTLVNPVSTIRISAGNGIADSAGDTATVTNIMLNEGSTALPYEPYFGGLRSANVTAVDSVGKNLWNNANAVLGEGTLTKTQTGFVFVRGSFAKGTSYSYSIPLVKGQTVTFSCVGSSYTPFLYLYKERAYGTNLMSTNSGKLTYTAQEDLPKATFTVIINSADPDIEVSNIQVELGETVTPYTPYVHKTITIPEAVQALPDYGEGIDGTYYNYTDFVNKQYVRMVKKRVFTGTENWVYGPSGSVSGLSVFWTEDYTDVNVSVNSVGYAICNHYAVNPVGSDVPDTFRFSGGSGHRGYFYVSSPSTLEEWKAKVAAWYADGNPLTIVYLLKQAEATDISDTLPDMSVAVGNTTDADGNAYGVTNIQALGTDEAVLDVSYLNSEHKPRKVVLNNGRKPVVPMVECSNDNTKFEVGSAVVTVNAGKHKILDLQLKEGENLVSVTGFGNAKFTYQEGDL